MEGFWSSMGQAGVVFLMVSVWVAVIFAFFVVVVLIVNYVFSRQMFHDFLERVSDFVEPAFNYVDGLFGGHHDNRYL